jgi:hypothetical protein
MADRSDNKKARTGQGQTRRKRSKDEPIRLEDLIPKNDVSGGRRVFGVIDKTLDEPRRKKEK